MKTPGPPPTPTNLKLLRGNPGKRKLSTNEPDPLIFDLSTNSAATVAMIRRFAELVAPSFLEPWIEHQPASRRSLISSPRTRSRSNDVRAGNPALPQSPGQGRKEGMAQSQQGASRAGYNLEARSRRPRRLLRRVRPLGRGGATNPKIRVNFQIAERLPDAIALPGDSTYGARSNARVSHRIRIKSRIALARQGGQSEAARPVRRFSRWR